MSTIEDIVIVGAGLAGAKTAEALRELGHRGRITIVGAEPHLPYERPPLSKDYLAGKAPFEDASVHPQDWYDQNDIALRLGSRVLSLDVHAHEEYGQGQISRLEQLSPMNQPRRGQQPKAQLSPSGQAFGAR